MAAKIRPSDQFARPNVRDPDAGDVVRVLDLNRPGLTLLVGEHRWNQRTSLKEPRLSGAVRFRSPLVFVAGVDPVVDVFAVE